MFNKNTSPFVVGRVNSRQVVFGQTDQSESAQPGSGQPGRRQAPITAPTLDITTVRREILLLYDRWTRADSGGFQRLLKAAIATLEDEDMIKNLPSLIPSANGSLYYTDTIRDKAIKNIESKRRLIFDDMAKCIISLEKTRDAVIGYREKVIKFDASELVGKYLDRMTRLMGELLEIRKIILRELDSQKFEFQSQFETLSLFLLMIAETGEDFIPRKTWEVLQDPLGPKNFEAVRANNGRDLFRTHTGE